MISSSIFGGLGPIDYAAFGLPTPGAPPPAPTPAPAAAVPVQTQVQPGIKPGAETGRYYEASQLTYDASGRPVAPMYESGRDAQGNLLKNLQIKDQGAVTADRSALDALKNRAMAEQSPWAKMALQKQGIEEAQQRDNAAMANQSQLNNAKSMLAQSGGLGGAARERLGRQAMVQGLMSNQTVNRQGLLDRANIGLQDEQMKTGLLNQVQTGENAQAQLGQANRAYTTGVNQMNVQNTMNDLNAKRLFDANSYNEAMRAWGADKSANAQAAAAGGGGGGLLSNLMGSLF